MCPDFRGDRVEVTVPKTAYSMNNSCSVRQTETFTETTLIFFYFIVETTIETTHYSRPTCKIYYCKHRIRRASTFFWSGRKCKKENHSLSRQLSYYLAFCQFILLPNQELSVLYGGPTLNYGGQLSLYVPYMLRVSMTWDMTHLQLSDLQGKKMLICRT